MSRPFGNKNRRRTRGPFIRTNGKIRAREVRVIGIDGSQVGVLPTQEAIQLARKHGVDLVEVASKASPPVCRIVDYGKYCYELSKKAKETKKHQAGNKTKEIQLRPSIDVHDFTNKLSHAVQFLCADMKVKISLRYRGRELAHKEIGFETMQRFVKACDPFGVADAPPKFAGRSLGAMVSPRPKHQRAPNPYAGKDLPPDEAQEEEDHDEEEDHHDEDSTADSPVAIEGQQSDENPSTHSITDPSTHSITDPDQSD
ncbi:MAG: translation initiation factor IF-3, partial [Verrucomicrobiia bacterium]